MQRAVFLAVHAAGLCVLAWLALLAPAPTHLLFSDQHTPDRTRFVDLFAGRQFEESEAQAYLPTVLVTGGLGFIGHRISAHVQARGHNLVVVDSGAHGAALNPDANWIVADVTHSATLANINLYYNFKKVNCLVHAAGVPPFRPGGEAVQHAEGTRNILQWAVDNNCKRVVTLSSIYGSETGEFASSKADMESVQKEFWERFNLTSVVLRLPVVYGPGDVYGPVAHAFYAGDVHTNDAYTALDLVYVEDVAKAALEFCDLRMTNMDVAAMGSGVLTSSAELAEKVAMAKGGKELRKRKGYPIYEGQHPAWNQFNGTKSDNKFMRVAFNYKPTPLEHGLKMTHRWLKSLKEGDVERQQDMLSKERHRLGIYSYS
mmetsp:Transcript_3122/g.7616  ORF Transcript_3122/g.7616 Transcript_3122/m.7616 type:complete len:373 (+) Transcript_3122:188-1306(+)|eukprot:CAMPEP_0177638102 /NCGR_PEP_ID=MMETSP0447-20121125/5313_1 /TAXON_ID=0 /ORGANISM="Stygamoeba regulata, Strain BSH-02190019" /LENGTH=372 /DNA_ID=CAMNT_0019140049 /DNA_START=142 /DNA_END=1260 /DNA_ORIENTATION=-